MSKLTEESVHQKNNLAEFVHDFCKREGLKNVIFAFVDEGTGFTRVDTINPTEGKIGDRVKAMAGAMKAIEFDIEDPNQQKFNFHESNG